MKPDDKRLHRSPAPAHSRHVWICAPSGAEGTIEIRLQDAEEPLVPHSREECAARDPRIVYQDLDGTIEVASLLECGGYLLRIENVHLIA